MPTKSIGHTILLLADWLESRLSPDEWNWLQSQIEKLKPSNTDRELYVTLGLIPRKLPRLDLNLSEKEQQSAQQLFSWSPVNWNITTNARILVLCIVADRDEEEFGKIFQDLCRTADLNELISYYTAINLLPHSEAMDQQIAEGLRSNIRTVFEAIAHRNPYPAKYFDQHRWNHMVLKALFVESTLAPIQGLDERANPELATILCNYAHERWAADRSVSPELWRCVRPFAKGSMVDDLTRADSESQLN